MRLAAPVVGLTTQGRLACRRQSNRLTKIEGLEGLGSLEELYLSHNGITKIEGLDFSVRSRFFR